MSKAIQLSEISYSHKYDSPFSQPERCAYCDSTVYMGDPCLLIVEPGRGRSVLCSQSCALDWFKVVLKLRLSATFEDSAMPLPMQEYMDVGGGKVVTMEDYRDEVASDCPDPTDPFYYSDRLPPDAPDPPKPQGKSRKTKKRRK